MPKRFRELLSPPVAAGVDDAARPGALLRTILLTLLCAGLLYSFFSPLPPAASRLRLMIVAAFVALLLVLLALLQRGHVRPAAYGTVSVLWTLFTVGSVVGGGVLAPAFIGFPVVVVAAGILLGRRAVIPAALICTGTGVALLQLADANVLPQPLAPPQQGSVWATGAGALLVAAVLLWHALRSLDAALAHARRELAARQQAEEQLRTERDLLSAIMNTSVAAVLVLDTDGHIVFANASAENVLGLRRDDLTERVYNSPEWQHTDLDGGPWPDERQPFRVVMTTQAPIQDVQHAIVSPTGERRFLSVNGAPLRNHSGALTGAVFSVTDITDRRLAEEQLRQSQKMEAIGQLAGGIAHDFNNLLTVILGSAQLLALTVDTDSPSRPDVDQIRVAAQRGASLVRQLLAFSRRQVLQPQVLDLNDVVLNIDPMLRRLIGSTISLTVDLWPEPAYVRADIGQMEQIILNLAVNARDAMPSGGRLTIATTLSAASDLTLERRLLTLGAVPEEGPVALLLVRDTGAGMDDTVKRKIFEPFFTTKPPGQGTGLGLSTVHGIVEQSGGFIMLETAPGAGTAFTIGLPCVDVAAGVEG